MPNPVASDLHVNRPLTNISVAYTMQQTDFFATQVFPNIPVDYQSDTYYKFFKGDWFRSDVRDRAPGTESSGTGYKVTTDSFKCVVKAVHHDIDDHRRANSDPQFRQDSLATKLITGQHLLTRENFWVNKFFKTGVWDTDYTGVNSGPSTGQFLRWNVAGSDPIGFVEDLSWNMKELTGYYPNTMVMGSRVFAELKKHPQILDRIKYTQRGQITRDLIASLFEMPRLFVASATQNTANEAQTASMSFLYGKHVLLCYAAPEPGLEVPTAGYNFSWRGYTGASDLGTRISKFRMEHLKSDRIEAEAAYDMKVVASDLGVFLYTAVA